VPVSVSTAVQAMKAAHISRPNCRFCMGMPVSAGHEGGRESRQQQDMDCQLRCDTHREAETRRSPYAKPVALPSG
jgi:hypothetical protein